ncbi:MAG TPA: hypothetical protein VGN34_19485, partial [Ktedonobacteraceae bacterium]
MLQGGGRCCEIERFLVGFSCAQAVDQAGSEGVSGSDAIDYVGELVFGAAQEFFAVEETAGPAVVVGTVTLS